MRAILVGLALLVAAPAAAQRPSTLGMSCNQARGLVASHGAVVLSTGRHTFDRFVASPGFCALGEWARPSTAPTADAASCPLGYVCETGEPPWDWDDDDFPF
jgi:hypothetical protein